MQTIQQQLEQQIIEYLQPFIQNIQLFNSQYPILPLTYTLWRKTCYLRLFKKYKQKLSLKTINVIFFKVSQHVFLNRYIQKVKKQINGKKIGWKKLLSEQQSLQQIENQQYQNLILTYSQIIYKQQLYVEMFYDLISIPYTKIYEINKNKDFRLNQKFNSNFYKKKSQSLSDKAVNVLGKNIISKGLTKITQVFLTKSILYGFTGLFGLINPLMMGVTFAIGVGIQKNQKSNKLKQIIDQITLLKNQTENNIIQLQQLYEKCLCSVQAMNILDQVELMKQRQKFNKLITNVLVQDWLQINIQKQDQWEIVDLKYKQDYQFQIINRE